MPEDRRIFKSLTVHENLMMGRKKGAAKKAKAWSVEKVYDIFPRLGERRNNRGATSRAVSSRC